MFKKIISNVESVSSLLQRKRLETRDEPREMTESEAARVGAIETNIETERESLPRFFQLIIDERLKKFDCCLRNKTASMQEMMIASLLKKVKLYKATLSKMPWTNMPQAKDQLAEDQLNAAYSWLERRYFSYLIVKEAEVAEQKSSQEEDYTQALYRRVKCFINLVLGAESDTVSFWKASATELSATTDLQNKEKIFSLFCLTLRLNPSLLPDHHLDDVLYVLERLWHVILGEEKLAGSSVASTIKGLEQSDIVHEKFKVILRGLYGIIFQFDSAFTYKNLLDDMIELTHQEFQCPGRLKNFIHHFTKRCKEDFQDTESEGCLDFLILLLYQISNRRLNEAEEEKKTVTAIAKSLFAKKSSTPASRRGRLSAFQVCYAEKTGRELSEERLNSGPDSEGLQCTDTGEQEVGSYFLVEELNRCPEKVKKIFVDVLSKWRETEDCSVSVGNQQQVRDEEPATRIAAVSKKIRMIFSRTSDERNIVGEGLQSSRIEIVASACGKMLVETVDQCRNTWLTWGTVKHVLKKPRSALSSIIPWQFELSPSALIRSAPSCSNSLALSEFNLGTMHGMRHSEPHRPCDNLVQEERGMESLQTQWQKGLRNDTLLREFFGADDYYLQKIAENGMLPSRLSHERVVGLFLIAWSEFEKNVFDYLRESIDQMRHLRSWFYEQSTGLIDSIRIFLDRGYFSIKHINLEALQRDVDADFDKTKSYLLKRDFFSLCTKYRIICLPFLHGQSFTTAWTAQLELLQVGAVLDSFGGDAAASKQQDNEYHLDKLIPFYEEKVRPHEDEAQDANRVAARRELRDECRALCDRQAILLSTGGIPKSSAPLQGSTDGNTGASRTAASVSNSRRHGIFSAPCSRVTGQEESLAGEPRHGHGISFPSCSVR